LCKPTSNCEIIVSSYFQSFPTAHEENTATSINVG
jgi:hypothetical protein